MKLLIKIPTRRADFFWWKYYQDNIELPETKVVLTLDSDFKYGDLPKNVEYIYSNSLSKIDAYNRDISIIDFDWDVIMVGSDDMWPQVKGFDRIILQDMEAFFPDTDGCLWYDTEDQHKAKHIRQPKGSRLFLNKAICTLPILGRKYYERFNYIYNPAYKSFFCDNEYTRIARQLNKIQYIDHRIVEHNHPSWARGMPADDLYNRDNVNWKTDMRTYNIRNRHAFRN